MANNKQKTNQLIQPTDAVDTKRPIVFEKPRIKSLKQAVLDQNRRKAEEEKREFIKNFNSGDDYYYESLRKEAERQKEVDKKRKKEEETFRLLQQKEEKQKQDAANKKYDEQRRLWTENQLDNGTALSKFAWYASSVANTINPTFVKGTTPRTILNRMYDIKNMLGTTAESMDEGDYMSTLDGISRTRQNNGAAEAHKQTLQLQKQKSDLESALNDVYRNVNVNGISQQYGDMTGTITELSKQISEIDERLSSLKDLDDLYKKTYIGERPIGFWNRAGEFFRDDLWEGIQNAMTYDSAKEYTKQRRTAEANAKYDNMLKEKGVKTGVERMINSPLGVSVDNDLTREIADIEDFQRQNNAIIEDLSEEAAKKLKTLEDTKSKWNVSSGYKDLIEAYQNGDLLDKNYIFAEYAQMLGSSMSSKEQIAATGIRFAGTVASLGAAATGQAWLAPWIINATEIGLTPLDYAGAVKENDIERAEKYVANIESFIKNQSNGGEETFGRIIDDLKAQAKDAYKEIGLTDDQIKERLSGNNVTKNLLADMASGIIHNEDPVLKAAMLYANRGLDAQQDANNFRTMSDLILQKSIVWLPMGAKQSIGSKVWTSVDRAAERAISNEVKYTVEESSKKTLRTRIADQSAKGASYSKKDVLDRYERMYGKAYKNGTLSNAIRKGYGAGLETGAALGYGLAGQHVAGAVGATANAAVHLARTQLGPNSQRLLNQVERFAARKYQAVYDKLLGDNDFAKLALLYGYKQAKVHTLSALSEGAEEAAQYIHEKDPSLARKYGWDGMSLGDMIANDLTVGGEIMNAYLAVLGIGDSPYLDDAEFWSNWKGGAMLGFTNQSSLVNAVVRGSQDVVKQYQVDKILTDAAIVNRELDDRDRASYVDIVRQVIGNNTQYVLNYIDRIDKEEGRRAQRVVSQEDIDATRKAVLEIASIANDKQFKKDAEAAGIEYGSEDYVIAVADQYALRKQARAIVEQRQNGVGEKQQVYGSAEFNKEIDEQVKIVNSQNAEYSNQKQQSATNAGDIAVKKAKEAREKAKQLASGEVSLEYQQYVPLTEEERSYANMTDEEFNQTLGEIRGNAENLVNETSDSFLRETLIKRAKAINRLTALLELKAKFNTINGFFDYIRDNLKMSPMRPDAKTIVDSIDEQIEFAKQQLSETDTKYEGVKETMSDLETLDYLRNGNIVGASSNQRVAVEIEKEDAILSAWSKVVFGHMNMRSDGKDQKKAKRYAERIKAIKKARERNQRLNWMVSEIESGDAITKLQKKFAQQDKYEAEKAKKNASQKPESPAFEAVEIRQDGQKSNLKNNKEEFQRRREAAKSRKINRRKKYRGGGKLMSGIPFQNIFLDVANELMYAAEVGAYKFSEFFEDLKDWANRNEITENVNDYINDAKQFYIRFRAKADGNTKANLDSAQDVIKFFHVQNPPVAPGSTEETLTIQQKIQKQYDNIVHDVSSHFDIIYDDGATRAIYTNKEAIRFAQYDQNQNFINLVNKLKTANTSKESLEQVLTQLTSQYPGFPVQQFLEYRDVDGIEEAIARKMLSYSPNSYVRVGNMVRMTVQGILGGQDIEGTKEFFGQNYDTLKDQINKIKNELEGSLTLISTPDYILYTDKDSNKRAALADIVFEDSSGALYIIDVRSTVYPSVRTHYTYINKKGFSIKDQVVDTLTEADEALKQLSGSNAKGLYMLPIVVGLNGTGAFKADSVTVEYDEHGKALFQVKDRSNPELSADLNKLKEDAQKAVDLINQKIDQYNDAIDQAGSYNTKYGHIEKEQFVEQQSAALYDQYIRNLSAKLDDINEAIQQLTDSISVNLSTLTTDIPQALFSDIDEALINTNEAVENLRQCAKELDAAYEQLRRSGLLVMKPSTYDEHVAMDAFISALVDTQVALDIALSNEESREFDFTEECTLIAAALQEIQQHRENFGKAGISVKNWWINNFAFGIKNNTTGNITSLGEQETAFLNTLNTWINTLMYEDPNTDKWIFMPELVAILDNPRNVDMRRWYSAIMHNGLRNLIDNFKAAIANDQNYDGSFDSRIAFAEWMLNQFDSAWGTEIDQDITNNPQDYVERLSNLSVAWKDLYSNNEKHSPAYASSPNDGRSMATSKFYYLMSIVPGFPNTCEVELEFKNGELRIWITGPTIDGTQRSIWLPFISTPYPGISPKDLRRMQIVNRANLKFIDKARDLFEYAKSHPEYEVRFDLSTNKGSIRYDDVGNTHNVQDWLMRDKDLYSIKLSKKDGIGLLRVTITDQNGKLYQVYGGDELRETVGQFDDEFRKQKINTNSGAVVYFRGSENNKIGVTIEPIKIGDNKARIIVDLIQKLASGVTQVGGFSIESMLQLMLYMEDPEGRISRYNNINSLVQIDGAQVKIGENQPLNVFSDKDLAVQLISNLSVSTSADILNSNLQTSQLQCFQQAKQLIASGAKYVDLPIGIRITADDMTHQNQIGANGTTWLGYMLRNGMLQTRAVGEGFKQLNISNLRLENKNNPHPAETQPAAKPQMQQQSIVGQDIDAMFTGLTMIVQEDKLTKRSTEEETSQFSENVESYFTQVFGEDQVGLWKILNDGVISKLPTGYVVGLCTTDLMQLSRFAPEEAAWHEAFHRVIELLLSEEERSVFYKAYSEKYGVTDERTIAEGLADLFVDFMNKVGMPKGGVFNKIKRFFKIVCAGIVVTKKLGIRNTRKLFAFFNDINRGKYRTRKVSEENKKRFNQLFDGWLAYTIKNSKTGQKLEAEHIADSSELNAAVSSIGYYIAHSLGYDAVVPQLINYDDWEYLEDSITSGVLTDEFWKKNKKKRPINKSKDSLVIDESLLSLIPEETLRNLRGDDIDESELTSIQRAFREILTKENIGAVSGHIANYIGNILNVQSRGNIEKREDEPDKNGDDFGENVDPQNLNIDRYDKASYEFSKLAGVSNQVKLFFATIPYMKFDENGRTVEDLSISPYGTPMYMPLEEVYSILENDLSDVKSVDELYEKLKKLAIHSAMHRAVFAKFHKLLYGDGVVGGIYGADQFGNTVCKDYDRESLAIQIVSALSSQKINFIVALSESLGDNNGKDIRIASSSLERDARSLPRQWSQILMSGQSQIFAQSRDKQGHVQFKDRQHHVKGQEPIQEAINFFQSVREALTLTNGTVTVNGKAYNKDSVDGIEAIKAEFVKKLHQLGIMISDRAFDHMLLYGFGNQGAQGLADCLNGVGGSDLFKPQSINSFIVLLNSIVSSDGSINEGVIEKGYSDNGFIKQLATWQGMYNRITVQNMALGLNGKQLFSISQNSAISHIIEALNSGDMNNEVVKNLMKFNYNYSNQNNISIGSIILKAIKTGDLRKMTAHTYIGLKTDNFGDNGSEYTEAAEIDDYIAKLTMLQEGYMLFPTMADKGTWLVLKGINIPGMRLITTRKGKNKSVKCENPVQVTFVGGKPYIMPSDDVINQMIEYAKTERASIVQCMEDLKTMPEKAKIANYHTVNKNTPKDSNGKPKFVVEPNGTRFLQLSKVYIEENGKLVGKNLNDPKQSSKQMLADADTYFFNKPLNQQRRIMGLTLAVQAEHEIQKAIDLGLVERYNLNKSWKALDGTDVNVSYASSENVLWNLRSSHLNRLQIDAVTSELLKQISDKDPNVGTWANIPQNTRNTEKLAKIEMVNGLAIAAILADATFRHIISSQEILRCFAGHPGMFKVEYTEGGIKNSTSDIQKRLGGLVSTGEDNIQNIPGIPNTYTCAELKDYKVSSKSRVSSDLQDMFVTAQVRNVYAILTGEWDESYKMSKDEIIRAVEDNKTYKRKIEKAVEDGEEFASMFSGGINVADGAAYITDTMCENLLRMRGAYNNKVKEAFDILRSENAYNWKKSRQAYKTVYDAVNLVTTKYTAYGFRDHTVDGQEYSSIAVPYYNKYALFPLFKCVASGKMDGIYQKMLNEGVDMLMMTSAVKVGSCGAVEFNGNEITAPFNKYEQSFGYLRRQLNTDPEEGEEITMGTQMIKICLQNLIGDRSYTDFRTGKTITGAEILEDMMGAINNLSKIGEKEIIDMFSSDGGRTVDPQKLANYLQDQLTSRNANKVLLDIIRPYTKDGKVNLHALSATADASWIESILISTINKKVIDITTPGASYVQRSAFAMDAKDGEGQIKGDANMSKDVNGGKRLEMFNEDGSMDCVISITFFDDLFDGKDMSFEEKRRFLIENGIIGGKANIVAYRIPTQAQSSIHALRVADVIPALKDTIILPEEFTTITGSDFDIDHLYLARYNYRMDKNGKLSNWMEKGTKKYYQNKLLGNMLTLLTDKDSINTTYKSIDSDVKLPKGCSEQVVVNESLESEPYNFGTLRAQVSVKNDFTSGKISIGPFALNSTSHMLTSHYNVRFRSTVVTENTRIKGFNYLLDDDGNFISAWLSGYISGAVDNAKDPFLAKLNTNQFTYNMLNLLLRTGFGETAVWFCAQPIIREMSAANERSKSQYAKDQSHKGSGLSRKEFAIMQAIKKYIPESFLTAQALKKWTTSTQKSDLYDRVRAINWIEQNRELLKEFAVNPSLQNITIDNVDYSREYVQQKVFFAWKSLEKYAVALGGLVQHTKIDTRKHGKSIIEINRYLSEYNKIFDPDEPDKSIWDVRTLQNFATSTWIDQKTKSAIRLPSFVLQNYTFSANPLFINAVLEFGRSITEPGEQLSSETANKISKQLQTAVKSRYFVDYVNDHLLKRDKDGNPVETADQHIRGLLVGKNNMARRLTGIKLAIELNPAYKRLANNGLIKQLYSMTEDDPQILHGELTEKPAFITVLDNVDSSKLNSDLLIDGWEDLLTDSDPYVRRWAQDLIVYAFMTSGEFKGWSKLFKYVPASWITGELNPEEESYSDYIERILQSNYDYSQHFDDIAANCFADRSIVDLVPFKNADGSENFVDQNTIVKIGAVVDITEIESVKPYILVKQDSQGKNTDAYALYKCIGFKSVGEDSVLPVYIRMKKKGYSKGPNNVYEYGWDFQYRGNENRVMNEKYNIANAIKQMSSGNDISPQSTVSTLRTRYLQLAEQHVEEAPAISNKPEQSAPFVEYARNVNGRPNYEVSSKGDSRFSAMNATFAQGTVLFGHDVGGRTIESVYQHGVKQGDWITDSNSKTGKPNDKTIIIGNTEDDSYNQGYLPLWQEWAKQNPQLIDELRQKAAGKVLTDMYASTAVSQARALADILNSSAQQGVNPVQRLTQTPSQQQQQNYVDDVHSVKISNKPQKLDFGRRTFGKYESNFIAGEEVIGSIDDVPFDTQTLNKIDRIFQNIDFIKSLNLNENISNSGEEKASGMYISNTENVDKAVRIVGEGCFDRYYSEDGEMVTKAADTLAKFIINHEDEFKFVGRLADQFWPMNNMLIDYFDGKRPMSIFDAIYNTFKEMDILEEEMVPDSNNYIRYSYRILPSEGELFTGSEYSEAESIINEAEYSDNPLLNESREGQSSSKEHEQC